MKILQINSVCGVGSTGRIAADIAAYLEKRGDQAVIAYGRGKPQNCEHTIRIGNCLELYSHVAQARLFDRSGFGSRSATRHFLEQAEAYDPDVFHLHNLHGYYLHIGELFDYLRRSGKPVVWTLHDCWAYTGHCMYYEYSGCDKWKPSGGGCRNCTQKAVYPRRLLLDASARNYADKRRLFTGLENLTLVTPSDWLAGQVEQSTLAGTPVRVIPNGVDVNVFRPTPSDFRKRESIDEKDFVVLGVAGIWEPRKGLPYLLELIKRLGKGFRLVVVGVTEQEKAALPGGVVGVTHTDTQEELAAVYSAADAFVNPTLEDNFPTTNLEALACGVPVITFRTGGSVESVDDATGLVTGKGDLEGLVAAVHTICEHTKDAYSTACVERARRLYDKRTAVAAYAALYDEVNTHGR